MIEQKEVIKMDMYQKGKIRAEKKKDDSPKSCDYHLNPYKMGIFKK